VTHLLVVPTFAPEMAAMIGIGVGIDYALFIATRFRQGLFEGRDPRDAVVAALVTSGRAVLFAGGTVVISLFGLYLIGQAYMIGLATACIFAVLLVLLAALTLLPALLGFAGNAIDRLHLPGLLQHGGPPSARGFWYGWSRFVQKRAWVTGTVAALVLVLLAIPLFSMRLAFTDAGNDPPALTTRQAFDLLSEGFGPGFNGPLVVAVAMPGPSAAPTVQHLRAAIAATPGVAFVVPPEYNAARTGAVLVAYPTTSPQAAPTEALVRTLRADVIPPVIGGSGVDAQIGGETAGSIDAATFLGGRLPLVIGAVLVLSFLLLLAVFRSVVLPFKAVVMNLLSVGAAYGVLVAVFQWGWLGSVIGIGQTGPIDPWIPVTMFTILFGLSMDYEVFLLSRIREEWLRTGENSLAVADGLAVTGRIITAAAAIMFCVFASFVIKDPLHILKVFGLGLAVAVAVDVTLVRMVLVPSLMELLGPRNWWMPRWLSRAVPTLGVEATPPPVLVPA
jgi:RND superfamily putative drug exporter